jgi:hypothetical protein
MWKGEKGGREQLLEREDSKIGLRGREKLSERTQN